MDTDEDEYGNIADEDLIEAFSQASQTLPDLPPSGKRQRISHHVSNSGRRTSRSTEGDNSGTEEEEEGPRAKKIRNRTVYGGREVPAAKILAATQAEALEALPDSSPYRIRGPIYKKPRLEDEDEDEVRAAPIASVVRRSPQQPSVPLRSIVGGQSFNTSFGEEIDDFPPDFLTDEELLIMEAAKSSAQTSRPQQRLVAVQQGLHQTTLFGDRAANAVTPSQAKKVHNYIADKPPEAPTHHKLNKENLKTWIYPLNLGKIRDYQYSIVRQALFHNTLVALPTGLGKTCIAATIMLNFFRWTIDSQIIFVAPTKPLVAQQVDACFNIVGIPRSQTTLLTGEQPPALRADEWESKRVFFMTPQTLDNDLRTGIADPKKIVLLVVDEAHRATGQYAYVKVVQLLRRFNKSFRILALTATPGASVEAVQDVIDNLEISKVEIRTEESIDIQQYVHQRNIEQIVLDPSDEMVMVKELLAKSLQPLVNQLCAQNAYYNKDPMSLTAFGMMQARKTWFASPAGRAAPMSVKGMMNSLFSVLASIAHSIKLLSFHGIKPFYDKIKDFRNESEASKNGGGKYRKQILENADFKKLVDRVQMWTSRDDFVGHPKLTYLCDTILNHFLDAGEGRLGEDAPPSSTRVIVFAEYRDSAEAITKVLNRHGPLIRASVFVGQADSKRSEGMKQSAQIETIDRFKKGKINVLVATSIGEEGLDIGQVDLIVCYDASSSPIRMLQRMGRTGRKRAGNIVLLLMRGKEEDSFARAKDNYEQMQKLISAGTRFAFRYDLSVRIMPREIVPEVDKRVIEIPLENTQDPGLPEPRRRQSKQAKKKREKKFHMPDGAVTGFQKASNLGTGEKTLIDMGVTSVRKEIPATPAFPLTPLLSIDSVLLDSKDLDILQSRYLNVSGPGMEEVTHPDVTMFPTEQRSLGPVVDVAHGSYTGRCVELFGRLGRQKFPDLQHIERMTEKQLQALVQRTIQHNADDTEAVHIASNSRATAKNTKATTRVVVTRKPPTDIASDQDTPMRPTPKRIVKKLTKRQLRDSEGEGDDLANSEDASEDSDDGESLQDFVVSTNAVISSVVCYSSSPPPTRSSPATHARLPKRLQVPISTDQSEDDSFDELLRGGIPKSVQRTKQVVEVSSDDEEDNKNSAADDDGQDEEDVIHATGVRKKQRMVVDDSDEESDE